MNLLAIETTGAKASVAIIEEDGKLTVESSQETMNHLQHLMPMIDSLLSNCGKSIDDVSVIAVSEGPGSFTGIRIGMAAAKALAQVLNIPVVSVPTLETFAYQEQEYCGMICPVFDAKRKQVYAGAYFVDGKGECHRLMEDGAYDLDVYLGRLAEAAGKAERLLAAGGGCGEKRSYPMQVTLFGDGVAPYGEGIGEAVEAWKTKGSAISFKGDLCLNVADDAHRYQSAAYVARLGRRLFAQGRGKSCFAIHPVYLRKAEAERKLEEATKIQNE